MIVIVFAKGKTKSPAGLKHLLKQIIIADNSVYFAVVIRPGNRIIQFN